MSAGSFVGIDLGAHAIQAVSLDQQGALADVRLFEARELAELTGWAAGSRVIAIDAPDRPSEGAHRGDERLRPKFQRARCGEVALALEHGYWVPWVTPEAPEPGTWIELGIALHGELVRQTSAELLEVYPYAAFRHLAPGPLPKKTSVGGIRARAALLRRAGVDDQRLEAWGHDFLDAALAALVARQRAEKLAIRVTCPGESECGGDGSAIWLPQPLSGGS